MAYLGTLDVAPGMSSQRGECFLASDLTQGEPARELEEQDMRAAWWQRDELEDAIGSGLITDAQSLGAYAMLLLHDRC